MTESHLVDPSARLAAAFRTIHDTRMRGLPFVNPALAVEAVGFAVWEGCWLGVLTTPWFMSLVLTPEDPQRWRSVAPGAKRTYRFPAGAYEFIGAHEPAIGEFQTCSLFSPVLEFVDAPTARLVATLAREALFDPANAETHEALPGTAAAEPGVRTLSARLEAPLSRRDLLHGRLNASSDADRG